MGIWLLAAESLILSLLWVATWFAWRGRTPAILRDLIASCMALLPTLVLGIGLGFYCLFWWHFSLRIDVPILLFILLGSNLYEIYWLTRTSTYQLSSDLQPSETFDDTPLRRRYAVPRWPLKHLAGAMLLAFLVTAITYGTLDAMALQEMKLLEVEALTKKNSLASPQLPDSQNAALLYKQFRPFPTSDQQWYDNWFKWTDYHSPRWPDHYKPVPVRDPELLKFLADQSPNVALVQRAAELPVCTLEPDEGFYWSERRGFDFNAVMYDATELLCLQAQVSADQGDMRSALELIQTALRLADHTASPGITYSFLASSGLERKTADALQVILSGRQPTLDELSPLISKTPHGIAQQFRRARYGDEAECLSQFARLVTEPGFIDEANYGIHSSTNWLWNHAGGMSLYRVILVEDDIASYRAAMKKYQNFARLSPHLAAEQAKAFEKASWKKRKPGYFAARFLTTNSVEFDTYVRIMAQQVAANTAIAVHRYRAEQGQLPTQLADLVPKYLPSIPVDPYDGQPLRWKVTGNEWVVYSIGPNLQDDGGMEWNLDTKEGDYGFYSTLPAVAPPPEEDNADDTVNENSETNNE